LRPAEGSLDVIAHEWVYECPICGIELAQSNFDTPSGDYFCPFCTTPQAPSRRVPPTSACS
jgi:rubrerythrin